DQFDAHPNPQPGNINGWVDENEDADMEEDDDAEIIFPYEISECKKKDRVKFAMATLRGRALNWWNGRTKSMGIEAANNTPWSEVKKWM
nr:putative reverse transcriptase domain-containing protein [Tanacetum cinerariifolium]